MTFSVVFCYCRRNLEDNSGNICAVYSDLPNFQATLGGLDHMPMDRLNLLEPLDRWRQACAAHLE